jgi:hypothetical protein
MLEVEMTDTKPTPRTDAAVHPTMLVRRVYGGFVEIVEASFARTLERELAALKKSDEYHLREADKKMVAFQDKIAALEDSNKRLVELLKEAQKTVNYMRSEHKMHGHITDASAHWAIKIDPELLREAGK